ncbi:MAG TPA: flagellar hook-length control protein FliK, partial [Devosia sp.]|nr:flagellar hook-length control protein FliK [Devosia sp.]
MGDISLSLNSQAIANALPPQSMHEIIPDILNDLNLDQAILDGMRKLGEAAQLSSAAQSAQGQTASIKSGANANEQTLLALLAQNNTTQTNTAQNAATPGALPFVATSLSEQPDNPLTPQQVFLAQETTAKTVLANTLSSNSRLSNDGAISQNTLLANAQVAESATDTLAAQLQRQLAIRGDAKQSANMQASDHGTKANTQTHAQAMSLGPNMATAAASVSQLPIVQTREVITSSDPLLVAQNLGHASTQAAQTALFKPVQAAYHSPQVNIPNVAMEITRHVSAGNNQFQIRLDPAELGRIDVRLHMDDGGNTHARLVVERPETLAMLQRDAHSLERALTQAG